MREAISTSAAAAPAGPYSQAIRVGPTLYLAGQIGLSPQTGRLVDGGLRSEARQALANLRQILAAAGMGLGDVVTVTVFLTEASDSAAFNEEYAGANWPVPPPARTTVVVKELPLSAAVELNAVAYQNQAARSS